MTPLPFHPLKKGWNDPGANLCLCVCFFVKVRPECQKYRMLWCLGRPGCAKKVKIFIVAGAPLQKKIEFRSRYVCVFVPVLRAKTTIGRSMCVCVCVFVCNPCVCLARGAKSTVFYGVWGARGAPKTQQSEMLREPPSNKNRCSLQVCVCFHPCFNGEYDNR